MDPILPVYFYFFTHVVFYVFFYFKYPRQMIYLNESSVWSCWDREVSW